MGKTPQPTMPESQHLLRRERNFYFIGKEHRDVVYSVSAEDLDEAWQQFRSTGQAPSAILFVIKTETEIYLAMGR